MMKINIGGETKKDGWKILNAQEKHNPDYIGNIEDLTQFENETIDEIYASHIIEHINQKKMQNTFKGIFRILKKGGKFYVSVPDLEILCHFFVSPLANKKIKFHTMRMIYGGQIDNYDYHYFGWNYEFMNDYLRGAGFSEVKRVDSFGLFDDTSEYKPYGFPISLNVIAIK